MVFAGEPAAVELTAVAASGPDWFGQPAAAAAAELGSADWQAD